MIFYILLVLVLLGLCFYSYQYPNFEKNISLILLGILVFVGALRDRIGVDYDAYIEWYQKGTRDDGLEFGYLAIMKVFRYLNLDYPFLFFFIAFFTYLFVYLGVRKYTKNCSLPLVLYVLIPVMFLFSFTIIRQSLSVAIAFYAFSHLLEKKYLRYFLLMTIGVFIHYSCLIPFVIFLIVNKWGALVRIRHLYLLMGLTFLMGQIGIIHWLSFFLKGSHYYYYVSSQFAISVLLLKLLAINAMGFLVINYYDTNGFQYSNHKYLLLLYVCSILILNLFSESIGLTRLYIYFRIFETILVAEIIRAVLMKRRLYLLSFICCFYLFPFFRAIQIDCGFAPEHLRLIPYKNLLFENFK